VGLVKEIVPQEQLLARALAYAVEIAEKSPGSVIISRLGAREVWKMVVSRGIMRSQELYNYRGDVKK
jgi:enoyl-CoA hydratase/carnithine racemase